MLGWKFKVKEISQKIGPKNKKRSRKDLGNHSEDPISMNSRKKQQNKQRRKNLRKSYKLIS